MQGDCLLESLQHVLNMYIWSLSENQASIQFRCKLIGLLLKQLLVSKHDFALLIHRVYHHYHHLHFWHLNFFSKYRNVSDRHLKYSVRNQPDTNFMVAEKLSSFHLMNFFYGLNWHLVLFLFKQHKQILLFSNLKITQKNQCFTVHNRHLYENLHKNQLTLKNSYMPCKAMAHSTKSQGG